MKVRGPRLGSEMLIEHIQVIRGTHRSIENQNQSVVLVYSGKIIGNKHLKYQTHTEEYEKIPDYSISFFTINQSHNPGRYHNQVVYFDPFQIIGHILVFDESEV